MEYSFALLGSWENDVIEGPAIKIPIDYDNNGSSNQSESFKLEEKIVGTFGGEIININLPEEDIITFKKSKEYKEMNKLFREKFYPDYIRYLDKEKEDNRGSDRNYLENKNNHIKINFIENSSVSKSISRSKDNNENS